ncbi:unnamed protein product [Cyprideis torosa]|uniref:Transcription initiation factor TFIID subunit 5 n=1 Tax=Cyprideis torosa TaxID=163714 RepID=A0A7R8ZKS0_9CRUS|nr:unnamed protein product [Cyprideis torosa]CAG0882185.1 unnamed protein product [Cyprideis torosa]
MLASASSTVSRVGGEKCTYTECKVKQLYTTPDAEEALRKETGFYDEVPQGASDAVWSAYEAQNDPNSYADAYNSLKKFLDDALDIYKEYYYEKDIQKLRTIKKKQQMQGNIFLDTFKANQFTVRLSRDAYSSLKRFLEEKKHNLLLNIIQEHIYLDIYEGLPRTKAQIDATAGAIWGEAQHQANRSKMFYGLAREPDVQQLPWDAFDEDEAALNFQNKRRRELDKAEKVKMYRELGKKVSLSGSRLPSVCFYTVLNSHESERRVVSITLSSDSSLFALGFADGRIQILSIVPQKLRAMKNSEELQTIDKEAADVYARMLDESTASAQKTLYGHSGPVYGASFSLDRTLLLSCSEDGMIRLWSLWTWTALVVYKGHIWPVWDVKFAPHGYYFASCSHDRTARLWVTDSIRPVRIFAGHLSDVDCIEFHPNSNYLATGSSDRGIRVFDCVTGACVRTMTGHKGNPQTLVFSNDGRFLCSGGTDSDLFVWDLAHGHLLARLSGHSATITSISFSMEASILATGSLDGSVRIWDWAKLTGEISTDDVNVTHNPEVQTNSAAILKASFPTKNTSVYLVHFTRRNLLLASGVLEG